MDREPYLISLMGQDFKTWLFWFLFVLQWLFTKTEKGERTSGEKPKA